MCDTCGDFTKRKSTHFEKRILLRLYSCREPFIISLNESHTTVSTVRSAPQLVLSFV